LSSLAFGRYVDYEDVYTEGITKITSADFAYAKVLGSRIKLFGTSKKKEDGSISAMVCPVMITNEHPLFAVIPLFLQFCRLIGNQEKGMVECKQERQ